MTGSKGDPTERTAARSRSPKGSRHANGTVPVLRQIFPAPVAAKVPEVIALFWVAKILTTAGGEATSDFLKNWGNIKGGGTEVLLFAIGLVLQFGTRRYRAIAYWFLAYAIAIFGTGVSDFLHLDVNIPYSGTTALWAVVLCVIFVVWHRTEGTLSIHSITTQRRECFYWATVFATFALGTALGDFTATALNLGYLASGILFSVLILIPALAWWKFGLNAVVAFWCAYVVTLSSRRLLCRLHQQAARHQRDRVRRRAHGLGVHSGRRGTRALSDGRATGHPAFRKRVAPVRRSSPAGPLTGVPAVAPSDAALSRRGALTMLLRTPHNLFRGVAVAPLVARRQRLRPRPVPPAGVRPLPLLLRALHARQLRAPSLLPRRRTLRLSPGDQRACAPGAARPHRIPTALTWGFPPLECAPRDSNPKPAD